MVEVWTVAGVVMGMATGVMTGMARAAAKAKAIATVTTVAMVVTEPCAQTRWPEGSVQVERREE